MINNQTELILKELEPLFEQAVLVYQFKDKRG